MVRHREIQKHGRPRAPVCAGGRVAYVADLVLTQVFVGCARCATEKLRNEVAHLKKSLCFQCAPVRHLKPHTLVGVNRPGIGRTTSPRPVDVARAFLALWRIG
jgi:hypothetical protein